MTTPTIYDIKYNTSEKAPYFFSRKTMKFFGQTLKDFKVKTSPSGRIFIYANMWNNGNFVGCTIREYKDNDLLSISPDELPTLRDGPNDILNFINSH